MAGDFALEGPEDELLLAGLGRWVKNVESGPVYGIARRREGVVGVPEQRSSIG